VVEIDSQAAHGTSARIELDHERDLALRAAGFEVVRYTWRQITEREEAVAADLKGASLVAKPSRD
jgi:very-short-patch-repair endonuclease